MPEYLLESRTAANCLLKTNSGLFIERWFLLLQDCTNFDETFQYDLAYAIRKARESLFPSIEIMLRLFGTLPVTTASMERSFSSLRRLKTYLRSTNGEERLNV